MQVQTQTTLVDRLEVAVDAHQVLGELVPVGDGVAILRPPTHVDAVGLFDAHSHGLGGPHEVAHALGLGELAGGIGIRTGSVVLEREGLEVVTEDDLHTPDRSREMGFSRSSSALMAATSASNDSIVGVLSHPIR